MRIEDTGKVLSSIQDGGCAAVITDDIVADLYLNVCEESLKSSGFSVRSYVIPHGEENKNLDVYGEVLEFLSQIPLTRSDTIVALGGGVVGDLAGFAAATYLRGIRFVQIPTTLTADVDSSIGGKTAVDLPVGKNLVGAFHQPAAVIQDSYLLDSLPDDMFTDGMGEAIKTGMIADEQMFTRLGEFRSQKELRNSAYLQKMIERCAEIKNSFVREDELDRGVRHKLNFGHTVGHAVEKLSGYRIGHGHCVAKGMAAITELAVILGYCSEAVLTRLLNIMAIYGLDPAIEYRADEIVDAASNDKKRHGDEIDIVIPREIGSCEIMTVTMENFRKMIRELADNDSVCGLRR